MKIQDKTAVVTGASKGIGRAIAIALAKAGADVAISARTEARLGEVADDIRDTGREAMPFVGDMASEQDVRRFIDAAAERFGGIDILVNNAGMGHFGPIAEMSVEQWDEMFNLNVRGLFIATQAALPHLRTAGESVVVNVASIAGKNHFAGGGGYAATKHAVRALGHCLLLEERTYGVRVLSINPGSVYTGFFDSHDVTEERIASMLHPDDVAESVLHMIELPQRAMVSEIDIRPSNPK